MAKKKKIPDKLKIWIEARKRYRLSHEQIQMARELGKTGYGNRRRHIRKAERTDWLGRKIGKENE